MGADRRRSLANRSLIVLSVFSALGALQIFFNMRAVRMRAVRPSAEISLGHVRKDFLDTPPGAIVVAGGTHSGDEYAAEVLRDAFGDDLVQLHRQVIRHHLLDRDELEDVAARTDVLWVMAVRPPCEWADTAISRQRELCERDELPDSHCEDHEFASGADYYRMAWRDVGGPDDGRNASLITSERQSFEFEDIFDLRGQKLLLMKQITDAVPRHVKILRLREFELKPDVFVQDLVKEYRFELREGYRPFPPKVDPQSASFGPEIFPCMDYAKWREAQQRIDWTLEGYFGYHRLDCRLCRGPPGPSAAPPSSIYVLGERNSGTTFASDTLALAFDPPNTFGSKLEKFSSDVPVLLHKHMFRHDPLDQKELAEIKAREDVLWIMVVRSPCDWAEGMFRKPYHFCPPKHPEKCGPGSDPKEKVWLNQNSVAGLSLLEFFTETEWKDWAESVPFLREDADGARNQLSISKVSANYTYPNVFSLRRHKLGIMRQVMEVAPRNFKLVRLKELERSPEMFIQSIASEFGVAVRDGYEAQLPSVVAHPTTCLTPSEWDAAQRLIDWGAEAEFGFGPSDCRMCYGYHRSTRLYDRVQAGKKIKKILKGEKGKLAKARRKFTTRPDPRRGGGGRGQGKLRKAKT